MAQAALIVPSRGGVVSLIVISGGALNCAVTGSTI
jgi:hypothetical protein